MSDIQSSCAVLSFGILLLVFQTYILVIYIYPRHIDKTLWYRKFYSIEYSQYWTVAASALNAVLISKLRSEFWKYVCLPGWYAASGAYLASGISDSIGRFNGLRDIRFHEFHVAIIHLWGPLLVGVIVRLGWHRLVHRQRTEQRARQFVLPGYVLVFALLSATASRLAFESNSQPIAAMAALLLALMSFAISRQTHFCWRVVFAALFALGMWPLFLSLTILGEFGRRPTEANALFYWVFPVSTYVCLVHSFYQMTLPAFKESDCESYETLTSERF